MKFEHLRVTPWYPTFDWVKTSLECADKINSYHEDYPKYVRMTDMALDAGLVIQHNTPVGKILTRYLLLIHRAIFSDKSFAGKLREVDVRVGCHLPPQSVKVINLMEELEDSYDIRSIEELIDWYSDFETIHPFQDGNGRVGGVIVAIYSHILHPDKGWLAPNQ